MACRYGSTHIVDKKNVIDYDRLRPIETKNCMSKEDLANLRKKHIKFPKSETYIKAMTKVMQVISSSEENVMLLYMFCKIKVVSNYCNDFKNDQILSD